MDKNISVAEAKATFSECIRKVEASSAVLITRHGKPVAALVSPGDLEHLKRLRKAGPESGLASDAGGWENSEELASIFTLRHRRCERFW
ncbi:MAG: type II toxin-antitoxin system Phd/YefM family antitoxin [Deltaproteobacteria bacterium]|nr:type II toxin-antitoxin system Phd/YefM family antitoxin [Deltaproteobacteria bacterium]MBW1956165.1 type II toxin-antitoxin system Phd/YefM family antitoxin [Deltaproteobacteria bacterium]MBW2043166.1 type II toxin-antitoxin system Phd/YefM family antitoxin [Deltaproteobacteria bacterium]MBW2132169.1 type II toxin-antitoxin system Phd/YefM family antitoxin [Deltaproteobacteria bacterium]